MKKLNEKVISTIRQHLPENSNIAQQITHILGIGRESVYRRLRSEINFTFEEISLLALKLGFSIDSIIETEKTENAIFSLPLLQKSDPLEIYSTKLDEFSLMISDMNTANHGKVRMALNKMPHFFITQFKTLSKFRLYKWFYQTQKINPNFSLDDFIIPKKITNIQNQISSLIPYMPNTTVILGPNIFSAIILEINYFYKRKLLTKAEMETLKEELLDSIKLTEDYASLGVNSNGSDVMMYISAIDLDTSYIHLEYNNIEHSKSGVFSISSLDSKIPEVCNIYKEWIDSLKKFSTLISQSGEIPRFEYFNKQRKQIEESLGKEQPNL